MVFLNILWSCSWWESRKCKSVMFHLSVSKKKLGCITVFIVRKDSMFFLGKVFLDLAEKYNGFIFPLQVDQHILLQKLINFILNSLFTLKN